MRDNNTMVVRVEKAAAIIVEIHAENDGENL